MTEEKLKEGAEIIKDMKELKSQLEFLTKHHFDRFQLSTRDDCGRFTLNVNDEFKRRIRKAYVAETKRMIEELEWKLAGL